MRLRVAQYPNPFETEKVGHLRGAAESSTGTLACAVFAIETPSRIHALEDAAAFKSAQARVPVLLERANYALGLAGDAPLATVLILLVAVPSWLSKGRKGLAFHSDYEHPRNSFLPWGIK